MAWESTEEQATQVIKQHMTGMSLSKRETLVEYYAKAFFNLREQEGYSNVRWITSHGVTLVTMWDEDHLFNNLRLAMVKEIMEVGPTKYCVINNWMPNFESKLMLLVHFLPHRKICILPSAVELGGPFTHLPWSKISDDILCRPISLESSLIRTAYYSQQYMIFVRTGFYGPSYEN